ncbi:NACHT domain-containing protein [Streptomyces sp. NPDC002530]
MLRRSLARLYDELSGTSATGRLNPDLTLRTDRKVWERLRREIAAQMELDRQQGRVAAPDRIPVLTDQTFSTLRWDVQADRPLSRDRLRVFEAVMALGRVGGRLPAPWTTRADEFLAADPPPARRAGDGGRSHLVCLENANDRALAQAGTLGGPGAVALADVYVVRGHEEALARRLEEQAASGEPGRPVQVVLGEPGTGKTSLLWYLATTLRERRAGPPPDDVPAGPPSARRRRGPALVPRLLRGEELLDQRLGARLLKALVDSGKGQAGRGRIVLIDSADLLLRAADGRARLRQVVELCQSRGTPLALTCRTRDRAQLEEVLGGAPFDVSTHVEDFRFDGEVERAVTAYCRHYLSEDIQYGTAERLLAAAVRGLPVREVVARPLTLRMLLQVYVEGMDTAEIDAAMVYDTYWARRVCEDRRHGADVVADTRDLSWPAQAAARLMLHDGTVALSAVEVAKRLPLADAGPTGGDPAEQVAVLEERGVLTRAGSAARSAGTAARSAGTASPETAVSGAGAGLDREEGAAGSVQFFHQTLYEYAAGRCVSRLADEAGLSYYQALAAHLKHHPDDFLRASVAEQAIVQGVRLAGAARDEAAALLLDLLACAEVDLQVIAVRCYAFLPHLYVHEREPIQRYLREKVPQALAEELLAILPTRCHPEPEVVTADLGVVLRRHPVLRHRVLEVLCRFGGADARASRAVWSLLHQLCADPRTCLNRPVADGDAPPTGCGGDLCLWSWLVRLDGNSATSHGNLAARLVDVLSEHQGVWGVARMRELLALARRNGLRAQVLQCLPAIHRRRTKAEWAKLMDRAAESAARLGPGRPGGPAGTEEDITDGQRILDAYWSETAAGDREPLAVLRGLAAEGDRPFDVLPPRLRGVLTRLGNRLRGAAPREVYGVLDEAVALCAGTDRIEQVARALLPPLLMDGAAAPDRDRVTGRAADPDGPAAAGGHGTGTGRTQPPGEGGAAAGRWCAHQLALFTVVSDRRPEARFAMAGIAALPPGRAARLVPWSSAARPSGASGGAPWGTVRCDAVWLAPGGAARLLVPLSAAGDHQALAALDRWRALEQAHHDQLVRGRNDWPRYHGDRPWHGSARTNLHKVLHPALADHAQGDHRLIAGALRHRIPSADLPWLARLAKSAANRPDNAHAAGARAALVRYGPDLAAWCSDLWDRTLPCPDDTAKAAALRLWGDLVRLGAAERPTLQRQKKLAEALGAGWWQRASEVFRHWNGLAATATVDEAGDPAWADLDAALATAATLPGLRRTVAPLRSFLHCRFAPLTGPDEVTAALAAARAEVRAARTTADIHACGAGFLAERLCAVDPAAAVSVTVMVAERAVGSSAGSDVPHHVTRLGWKWQKPLTRLATDTDPAQWHTLLSGLAHGPLAVLQKALDLAALHRRDEDLRAVAESALAAGPYLDEALAGLRDAAIRHRRTPVTEPRWTAILDPAAADRLTVGLDA